MSVMAMNMKQLAKRYLNEINYKHLTLVFHLFLLKSPRLKPMQSKASIGNQLTVNLPTGMGTIDKKQVTKYI